MMATMIVHRLHHWAVTQPHRPAIVHDRRTIGYAVFWRALLLMRRMLEAEKLRPGQVAIVMIDNLFMAWLAVLALHWMGIDTVAIADLRIMPALDLADMTCLVRMAGEALPAAGAPDMRLRTVTLPAIDPQTAAAVDAGDVLVDLPAGSQGHGGHLLYTSGTTGAYKKLLFDAAREDGRNETRAQAMGFSPASVFHGLSFGLWTGAGYKQPLAAWHRGACMVFDQRPGPFARFFGRGITKVSLLPPMVAEFLAATAGGGRPASPLEINVMSGFLSLDVAREIVARVTPNLCITYSATELVGVPMQTTFRSQEDLDWLVVSPGAVVEVVDETGAPCRTETEGRIRIELSGLDCRTYLDNPAASAAAFRDGWFYPGDMGVRRADGRVRVLGRIDDVINLHGAKMPVAPLEQFLRRRLGVEDVCLFAHLNRAGVEELLVAVQALRPLPATALAWLRSEFPRFVSIRVVVLTAFPRTLTGTQKVMRRTLKAQLLALDGPVAATPDPPQSQGGGS